MASFEFSDTTPIQAPPTSIDAIAPLSFGYTALAGLLHEWAQTAG
jgi:hypothetical protein